MAGQTLPCRVSFVYTLTLLKENIGPKRNSVSMMIGLRKSNEAETPRNINKLAYRQLYSTEELPMALAKWPSQNHSFKLRRPR